eukprot:gb/GFBE01058881.1/.p1 GENE.gb/GFBE01058881.1/~~gb/GFBE01058881.1/.p1  ORF type:complete len:216 (+),score=51.28 gb/GFBE01058881.1/:1-648(+)
MMHPILKSRFGHGGLATEVEEPTSYSLAMGAGAAAGGGLAFMMCAAKCPGGVSGAFSGMLGAMNPFSMMSKKDEKDAKEQEGEPDSMDKVYRQVDTIEKEMCNMNCKMAGLLGVGAGAAAGKYIGDRHAASGGGGMGGMFGGGGGGGGGMGGGGGGAGGMFCTLDEWSAPPFFVFMKQLDEMQARVNGTTAQVERLRQAEAPSNATKKDAKIDFF